MMLWFSLIPIMFIHCIDVIFSLPDKITHDEIAERILKEMKKSKEGRALLPSRSLGSVSSLTPASKFKALSPFGNSEVSSGTVSQEEITIPPPGKDDDYRMFVSQFRKINPSRYASIFRPGEVSSLEVSTSANASNSNNERAKRWITSSSSQMESNRITSAPPTTWLSFESAFEKFVKLREQHPSTYKNLLSNSAKNNIETTPTVPTTVETPFITKRPLTEDERKILSDLRNDDRSTYDRLFPSLENNEVPSVKEAASASTYNNNGEEMKVSSSAPPVHISTTSTSSTSNESPEVEVVITKFSDSYAPERGSTFNRLDADAATTSSPPTPFWLRTLPTTPAPTPTPTPTKQEPTSYSFLDPYTVEASMSLSEFRRQYPSHYQHMLNEDAQNGEHEGLSSPTTVQPRSEVASPSPTPQQILHTTTEKPVSTLSEFRERYPVEYDYVYNKGGTCDSITISTPTTAPEGGYNQEQPLTTSSPLFQTTPIGIMDHPSTTLPTLTQSQLKNINKLLGTSAIFSKSYSDYLPREVSRTPSENSSEKSESDSDRSSYTSSGKSNPRTRYLTTSEYYRERTDGAVSMSVPADDSSLTRKLYNDFRENYPSDYERWFTTLVPKKKSLSSNTDVSLTSSVSTPQFSSNTDPYFSKKSSRYLDSKLSKTFKEMDSMF